jgi:Kef-type K+ transport system membrane component KefB
MNLSVEMLLPLAGILLGAKLAGRASQRLGFPAVFGELLLGLLIGPSVLGWVHSSEALHLLADIGVILLMFMAGMETDLKQMRRVGKASLLAAVGGVALPMLGGLALGLAFGFEMKTALFIGVVLTATSVSISAQTLRELGHLRSKEGTAILSAAIIDDILGVVIFAVVMSLAGEGIIGLTLLKMALFFPLAWFVGDRILPFVTRWTQQHRESGLAMFLGIILVYAWAAEVFGSVATITGAYLLGVLVTRHVDVHAEPGQHIIQSGTAALGYGFLIPIFFVNIGLQAQTGGLVANPLLTVVLVIFAVASKVIGAGGGALAGGFKGHSALKVGVGMVSRGEVALVLAGAGLAAGLIDAAGFSIMIFITLVTTLVTPPLLRLSFASSSYRATSTTMSLKQALTIPDWRDFVLEEVVRSGAD